MNDLIFSRGHGVSGSNSERLSFICTGSPRRHAPRDDGWCDVTASPQGVAVQSLMIISVVDIFLDYFVALLLHAKLATLSSLVWRGCPSRVRSDD